MIIDYQTRDNGANRHSFSPRRYVAICLCILLLCSGLVFLLRAGQSAAATRGLTARDLFAPLNSPSTTIASSQKTTPQNLNAGKVLGVQDGKNGFLSINVPTNLKSLVTAASIVVQGETALNGATTVNAPATFLDQVILQGAITLRNNITGDNVNIDVGSGKVTASNLVYSVKAGSGISISGDQDLVISSTVNVPDVKTFKKIVVGSNTIEAGAIDDTVTFKGGTNINLSSSGKEITIAAVSASAGWQINAPDITTENNAYNVGIGTQSPAAKLHVIGDGNTSLIVDQSGSGSLLDVKTAGTTKFLIQNSGNVVASGDLTVNGVGSFTNGLTVNGPLTLAGFSTANGILYTNGSGVVAQTGQGASGTVLKGNGASVPTFGQVDLTTDVTGTLPIARGGTNSTATPTAGSIAYGTGAAYAFSSQGSPGECLVSGGSGAPSWASCGSGGGGTNNWIMANGAIYPINSTVDLLAGGQSTASAGFAVTNLNGGVPTAFLSDGNGKLYLTADGEVYTTNSQNLTLGNATTGNIVLKPTNGSGSVSSTGTLNLSSGKTYQIGGVNVLSSTTLGSGVTLSSLTQVGALTSGSIGSGFGTIATANTITGTTINGTTGINTGAGAGTQRIDASGNIGNINNLDVNGTVTFSTLNTNKGVLFTNGSGVLSQTGQGAVGTVLKGNGSGNPFFGAVDLSSDVSGVLPIARGGTNTNATPTAGALAYGTGAAYAFTAQGAFGQCIVSNGAGTPFWADCASTAGINWTIANGSIYPINATLDLLVGGTSTASAKFAVLNVNAGTPTASISASSGNNATYLTGNGTLATTNRQSLTIGNSSSYDTTGNVLINPNGTGYVGIGTSSPGGPFDVQVSNSTKLKVLANGNTSIGGDVIINNGGTGLISMAGGGFFSSSASLASIGSTASVPLGFYVNNAEKGRFDTTGNFGIGTTSPVAPLHISAGYANNAALIVNNLNSGDLIAASASGTTKFILANNGNITATGTLTGLTGLSSSGTVTFSAFTTNGGLLYTNGSGVLAQTAAGNAGECIVSNGGGAPTWTSCSAASGINWRFSAGTLAPINDTVDVLIGGSATASAKFAFINVNSGTPTASISAGVAGASYLTADGVLATTAKQTLTLGSATTGNLNLFGFSVNGGLLYTNGSGTLAQTAAGNNGECLISSGGGAPTWSSCSASSGLNWRIASGAISPINDTLDLLIGSNASSSAKFAFLNVNSGTPTASISGSVAGNALSLTGDGVISTSKNRSLVFNPNGGNVGIGTSSPVYPLDVGGDIRIGGSNTTTTLTAGSNTSNGPFIQFTNAGGSSGNGSILLQSGASGGNGSIQIGAAGSSFFTTYYPLTLSTFGPTADIKFTPTANSLFTAGNVGIGTNSPVAPLHISTGYANNAALIVNNTNSGNLLAASASGVTKFTVASNGAVSWGATTATNVIDLGGVYLTSTSNIITGGGLATNYIKFGDGTNYNASILQLSGNNGVVLQVNSATKATLQGNAFLLADSGTASSPMLRMGNSSDTGFYAPSTTSLGISTSGVERMRFLNNGNIGIGTTSPVAPLHISAGYANNAALIVNNLNSGDLFTASAAGTTKFTLANNGNITASGTITGLTGITSSGTIQFSNLNTAGGVVYTDNSGILATSAQGSSGQCLVSNGASAPSWASCAASSGSVFTSGNGLIYPINSTMDFAIGGQSTASAKFAVLNMNGGTPVASISANSGNIASYHTGDGAIGTTNRQTLTLGNSSTYNTTGNVLINPNGTGYVGIGTTTPTTGLHVASSTVGTKFTVQDSNSFGSRLDFISSTGGNAGNTGELKITAGASGQSYLTLRGGGDAELTQVKYSNGAVTWALGSIVSSAAMSKWGLKIDSNQIFLADSSSNFGLTTATTLQAPLFVSRGYGSNASFIVNNPNSGDILAASASGTTKFRVANNGDIVGSGTLTGITSITANGTITGLTGITSSGSIQFSGLNTAGGIVYTDSSGILGTSAQGSAGQCLQSGGAGTPTWGSCGVGGLNWTIVNGTIYPVNTTLDLLVGGTASSSAKFAVLNMNSGTPTASISAGAAGATYLTADGSLGTTAQQTLVLGTSTTGNITLAPNSGSGKVTSTGTLTLASGKTYQINGTDVLSSSTLGSGITVSSLTTVGALTSGSIASGFGTIATGNTITGTTINGTVGINTGAGAGTQRINSSGDLVNIAAITASGSVTFSTFTTDKGILYTNGSGVVSQTGQGATGTVLHGNGTSAPSFSAVSLTADISGVLPIANGGTNTNTTPTAGAIAYGTGTAYAFSAQGTSGQCLISGGSGAPSWTGCSAAAGSLFGSGNGLIYPLNSTMDFAIGGQASTSAKFAFLNVNNGTPTASISASSGNIATYLTGDGTLATTNRQTLTIGNSSTYNTTGNVLINPNGTGNVFIGTSTTSIAKLEVNGAIRVAGGTNYGTSSGFSFNSVTGDADGGLFSPGDGIVTLVTNSNEAVRVTSTGSVGIGDSSPASLFTVGNGDLFQVNSSGNIVNIGGSAHSIINTGGTLAIESSGNGNITIGAAGAQKNIQIGNNTGNTSLNFYSGTGAQTFTSSATSTGFSFVGNSVTSGTAFGIAANAVNTGTAFSLTANALSTGTGLSITSTSTGLTTGTLGSFDWSPSSTTNATGDLLSLNVGANGTLANIFNIKNNGSSVFSVSQSQITANLPTQFTAAGDVGIAYDISMTNPTASFIRSQAPLYIQSGETFNSSDLTLRTFNSGNLVFDTAGGVTLANGNNWSIPSASTSAWMINNGQLNFDTTNGRIGIANTTPTATLDVTGTASVSGNLTLGNGSVIQPAYGPLTLNYKSAANTWAAGLILQDTTGNIGVGTSNPLGAFVISKGYSNNASFIVNNPNSGDLIAASASGVTKFSVSNAGNASASGTLTLGGTSGVIQPADGPLTLNYKSAANTWAAGITLQQTTGNIGLGTSNPLNKVDILGNGTAPALRIKSNGESPALELADAAGTPNRWWLLSGLASTTDGTFSIFDKRQSISRLNIDSSGNLGIADTSPNVRMVVADTQTSSFVANIINYGNNDNSSNAVVDLRTGTGAVGTSVRFMRFYAGASTNANGTGVGRIRLNNTAVAYESGGADFAEWFEINGGAETGDLIAVTDRGNVKASNGASILGVVSDTAAFIGNSKKENPGPNDKTVGLVGQIKTKVTTMNGVIKAGDPIMSSSIPGVGQKTTQAAHIVGKAMEDFDPANGKGEVINCPAGSPAGVICGKIMVSVQATYYNPNVVNPEQLNFVANQQAAQQATLDDLQASFEIATTGELKIKKSVIFTQAIVANAKATFHNVAEFLGDVNFKGNVTFSNPIVFETKDAAGFAKIKAGDSEVRVEFSKQYMSLPITNVTPDNPDVRVGIKDRSTSGFTIYLKQPASQDENFSWSAIIVKDVETKISTGSASVAPSSSPSSAPTAQPSSSPAASPTPSASPVSSPTPSPSASPVSSPTP